MSSIEWRPVVGYEGLYEVSSNGYIMNVARRPGTSGNNLLVQSFVGNYLVVTLSKNNKHVTKLVHRLVADAFIGSPNGKLVHHKDHDYTNNSTDNLQYLTPKEHRKTNRQRLDWHEAAKEYATGRYTHRSLADKLGVSKSAICYALAKLALDK